MAEHFLTDRKYLPIAARYEFLRGFPILKAYRNFCQAVGNDAMNYKDFDFWWFRFSKGNFDLDTQPPQTADLNSFPDHIIGKIIGKTGYAARCLFRKTSKKYRKAVDSIPFVIDRLKFEHREQSSSLEFNGFEIQFYRRIGVYGKYKYPNRIMCRSKNYSKLAVNELVFIFGLKNVRVKKFTMYVNGRYVNENLDILKSLDFKFRVETFKFNFGWIRFGEEDLINVQDEVMKILPYLEPRVLQNVEFHINHRELKLETNRIVKTLQWKYLKRVNIYGNVVIKKSKMAEHFLTNQKYLPIAARYEYCKGVSVLEAHRNFCKALGDNAMSYKDFDFWWFRFSKGNFDLDTQPPQTAEFTDIPHHIIENIIRKMDYAARCLFRKTSKKYRRAVDTIPFIIKELKFESLSQSTWLRINQLIIEFNRREEINHNDPNRILLCSRHYLKLAVRELIFIFRLRNVRVKKFSIYVNDGVIHENLDILKALAFKFRVETFKIGFEWDCYGEEDDPVDVQNEVMKVLPFLKPCALKSIEFYIYNKGLKLETDRIARTLQWKYAMKLNVDGNVIVNTKSLKHFEKLTFLKDNLFTF